MEKEAIAEMINFGLRMVDAPKVASTIPRSSPGSNYFKDKRQ